MTSNGFLFPKDQAKERRRKEWERRSRIYGTEEFWQAYAIYIQTPQWRKLCQEVKKRAHGRCEQCGPHVIQFGPYHVHHVTYDRFRTERLSDLQYLCVPCHKAADRERERRNQRAYEEAGDGARDAKGMDTYFTKRYGPNWAEDHFGNDMASAYEDWWEWKQGKSEEGS